MLMIWPNMYTCPDEVQTVWCRHVCMLFVWFQLQTSRASCKDLLCYLSGVYYYQGMQIIWKNTVPSCHSSKFLSTHTMFFTVFAGQFRSLNLLRSSKVASNTYKLLIKLFVWLKTSLLHLTFLCYFCEKSA